MRYVHEIFVAQTLPISVRALLALVLLFVVLTGGLVIINMTKRAIRRLYDDSRRPKPFQPPPSDDWARKPMVSAEPAHDDMEASDSP